MFVHFDFRVNAIEIANVFSIIIRSANFFVVVVTSANFHLDLITFKLFSRHCCDNTLFAFMNAFVHFFPLLMHLRYFFVIDAFYFSIFSVWHLSPSLIYEAGFLNFQNLSRIKSSPPHPPAIPAG